MSRFSDTAYDPATMPSGVKPDGLVSCKASAKRKRGPKDYHAPREPKMKKNRKTQRHDPAKEETFDLHMGVNMAIGKMNSSLLADHVAQRAKRFGTDLSLVELEDMRIPGTHGI